MNIKISYEILKVSEPIKPGACSPRDIAEISEDFRHDVQENFYILGMNIKNDVIFRKLISKGKMNSAFVDPADIIRPLLIKCCNRAILMHNHPSGNTDPSPEDIETTTKIIKACEMLNIAVLDHLIVTGKEYYSFREKKLIS